MSTSATTTSSSSSSGGPSATANPMGRTLIFVGLAGVCLAITTTIEVSSRPAPIQEFGQIGQMFYPDFIDPTLATELEVHAFDTEAVSKQEFIVKRLPNGRWSIPSRHNYPADAEDQLAKTAASVIGIERGAMVTRWTDDHAKYGVVDPGQDALKVDEVEGVGKRLILRGENEVLVDYIIGDPVESDESGDYYVRRKDDEDVYITKLSIDLSTRFTDWIDTDLLHINQSDLRQLTINDYEFDELQGTITTAETSLLKRENSSDPWVLGGLDEETEEVDKDAMREAESAIADMKIVGVRPKKPGLSPELTLDRSAIQSQNDVQVLQSDLMSRGFLLQPDKEKESNSLKLIAREGELYAATEDGLIYRMHFGRAFTGTQDELEFGLSADESEDGEESEDNSDDAAGEDASEDDDADESGGDEDRESDSSRPGRYVFVRVEFDEVNLGERPAEPVVPEMPEELKQAGEEQTAAEADTVGDSAGNDEAAPDGDGESDSEPGDGSDEAEEDPLEVIRKEYETAQKDYELNKMTYDNDLESFEKKVEDGQKKAEDLNRRFAEWYYVVSGETFDKLRLSRSDIVKMKEEETEDEPDTSVPSTPDVPAEKDSETNSDIPDAVDSQEGVDSSNESADTTDDTPAEESADEEPGTEESSAEEPATREPAGDDSASGDSPTEGSTDTPQETPSESDPLPEAE